MSTGWSTATVFFMISLWETRKRLQTAILNHFNILMCSMSLMNTITLFFQSCLRFAKITHIAKMMIKFNCVLWFGQKLGDLNRLFFDTRYFETETCFRDQILQNRNPHFFSVTETETYFPRPNFLKHNPWFFPWPNSPKPSKDWQKSRNWEVSKPKCQPLLLNLFNNL